MAKITQAEVEAAKERHLAEGKGINVLPDHRPIIFNTVPVSSVISGRMTTMRNGRTYSDGFETPLSGEEL